jgi:hypothetical protein
MSGSTTTILSTLTLAGTLGIALWLRKEHAFGWPAALLMGLLLAGGVFTVAGI